jgi:hypothetical protein
MIGDYQHCQALSDVGEKQVKQAVHLAFEARRNVVD